MAEYTVKEVMQSNPVSAVCGELLIDVVEKMAKQRVLGMPVVDDKKNVVGFISEQDCIHSMLATSYFCEGNPTVDDVMSRSPLTVKPADSVLDLARRMETCKPKIYPVVEEGKLIGVISRSDILRVLRQEVLACAVAVGRA